MDYRDIKGMNVNLLTAEIKKREFLVALLNRIEAVGLRFGAKPQETIDEVIRRAAAHGDKEAIELFPLMGLII